MKIRQGFVSNSSSQSFCIYGAAPSFEDMEMFLPEEIDKTDENWKYEIDWNEHEGKICEVFGKEFSFYFDYECDDFYIGRSLETLKDDETGKQFRESVEKKCEEVFKKPTDCRVWAEEIGY